MTKKKIQKKPQTDWTKFKYFHPGQQDAMIVSAAKEYYICPRGYGKSEGIDGPKSLRNVLEMPGSRGGLMSPSYTKLLQNTLPPIFASWERLGYKRDVHFFVNKRPPAKLRWPKPIVDPVTSEYQIYWFNGSVQSMISFDRSMSANSMSLDYLFGFEAKFLPYSKICEEVKPANRGNRQYFGKCPFHHGEIYTTDMPTTKAGYWIFKKEHEMDPDLILAIRSTYEDIQDLEEQEGLVDKVYYRNRMAELKKELAIFRKISTYYCQANPFDNLDLLGRKFFADAKRENTRFIYRTMYLNKRPKMVENGFYSAMTEDHCYKSSDKSYLDALDFNLQEVRGANWRADGDLNRNMPLFIALDYNSAINSMTVGQPYYDRMELRTVKALFVKTPDKIRELVKSFCNYYQGFPKREVVYFYDTTAIHTDAKDVMSFKDIVVDELTKNGWEVHQVNVGQPMGHMIKHEHIDHALKGAEGYLFPTYNQINCDFMITAMENTSIVSAGDGFKKDKSGEKKPETSEEQNQYKTHITDAWDTLWIGCQFFYKPNSASIPMNIRILS